MIKSTEASQRIEVVETIYAKLVDAWGELEGKHLEYVNLLTDEHLVDEEEIWMTEVKEKYSNAFNRKVKYVENVTTSEKAMPEHAARQEAIDNAKVKRTLHARFSKLLTKVFRTRCSQKKFPILR